MAVKHTELFHSNDVPPSPTRLEGHRRSLNGSEPAKVKLDDETIARLAVATAYAQTLINGASVDQLDVEGPVFSTVSYMLSRLEF